MCSNTIIDGGGNDAVVTFGGTASPDCVLSGFVISNGDVVGHGGGIDGNGSLATIEHNIISDNSAKRGGGLFDCNGTIQNNTISGNSAMRDAGGLYN